MSFLQVTVSNAPNFTDAFWSERIDEVVEAFEGYKRSYGHNSTTFWLREWRRHLNVTG